MKNEKRKNNIGEFINAIEKFLSTNTMDENDYITIRQGVARRIVKYKTLDVDDVLHTFLLDIYTHRDSYLYTNDINIKKGYLNFYILKAAQVIIKNNWFAIDIPRFVIGYLSYNFDFKLNQIKSLLGEIDEEVNFVDDSDKILTKIGNQNTISTLFKIASRKQKYILKSYFWKGMTQKDIADKLGITQQRVQQIISDLKDNPIMREFAL